MSKKNRIISIFALLITFLLIIFLVKLGKGEFQQKEVLLQENNFTFEQKQTDFLFYSKLSEYNEKTTKYVLKTEYFGDDYVGAYFFDSANYLDDIYSDVSFFRVSFSKNSILEDRIDEMKKQIEIDRDTHGDLYEENEIGKVEEVTIGDNNWIKINVINTFEGGYMSVYLLEKTGYLIEFDIKDDSLEIPYRSIPYNEIYKIVADLGL